MTQEDRELLLKDLSARLPYGVKCTTKSMWDGIYTIEGYRDNRFFLDCPVYDEGDDEWIIESVVPYLRPMSSMTEEEAKELSILYGIKDILSIKITDEYIEVVVDDGFCSTETRTIWYDEIISSIEIFDWLNKKMFDYRGLIDKGLVLEAPEGMYN
jgi:hypothetical protein